MVQLTILTISEPAFNTLHSHSSAKIFFAAKKFRLPLITVPYEFDFEFLGKLSNSLQDLL